MIANTYNLSSQDIRFILLKIIIDIFMTQKSIASVKMFSYN